MLDLDAFRASLASPEPPERQDKAVQALWWAGKGGWERAHELAQEGEGSAACDWVHAYLHRVEGDLGNAAYWYRRAGHPVATGALEAEWAAIAESLLGRNADHTPPALP